MGTSLGGTFTLYGALHDRRIRAALCHNAMDISSDLHVATRFPALIITALRLRKVFAGPFSWFPVPLKVLIDWHKVVENKELLQELYEDPLMVWHYSLGTWNSFADYGSGKDLGTMETPVKVVVGNRDRLFTPEYCRSLSSRIGKGGACFEVIPGSHALTLECIPEFTPVATAWFRERLSVERRDPHGAH
jgi:pimeloyl-ACP methyl ester carboxylesterase